MKRNGLTVQFVRSVKPAGTLKRYARWLRADVGSEADRREVLDTKARGSGPAPGHRARQSRPRESRAGAAQGVRESERGARRWRPDQAGGRAHGADLHRGGRSGDRDAHRELARRREDRGAMASDPRNLRVPAAWPAARVGYHHGRRARRAHSRGILVDEARDGAEGSAANLDHHGLGGGRRASHGQSLPRAQVHPAEDWRPHTAPAERCPTMP